MARIALKNRLGKTVAHAIVDDDLLDELSKWKWFFLKTTSKIYVGRSLKRRYVYLHRHIMKPKNGSHVDHINGDTLDNRKCNLRLCTNKENSWNSGPQKNTKEHIGVFLRRGKRKTTRCWFAHIAVNGKKLHLGCYRKLKDAIAARIEAQNRLYGKFANAG